MTDTVSILKCDTYEIGKLRSIIKEHFQYLGGIEKYVSSGTKVLLKVNLLMPKSPEKAVTTHPAFVEALAAEIVEAGGVVTIADSPGGPYNAAMLSLVYRTSGMDLAAKASGAVLNQDFTSKTISREENKVCRTFNFIKPYHDCDLLITVAKLKTHTMATYSGAVKNLFGLIPGLEKPEFHFRYPDKKMFCEMLIDLCETAKPSLAFMDGILAHEGNGPSGGTPRQVGLTFASQNPHCLDLAAASVIGLKADDVFTLSAAAERELCPKDAKRLLVVGADLASVLVKDFKQAETRSSEFSKILPGPLKKAVDNVIMPKPLITNAECIGCGKCAESCPMKTIRLENKKAHIDYSNCIKCFCCQEMCPVKAIRIHRFGLFKNRR